MGTTIAIAATTIRKVAAPRSIERMRMCGVTCSLQKHIHPLAGDAASEASPSGQASTDEEATSCFDRPAPKGEHPSRPFLNEENDEHENGDLAKHRARIGLDELVGDTENEGADQRAPKIADAAEHNHHEAVDDVALTEIGADIVDLRQRHSGHAGNARAQAECESIDAAGADAHRSRHGAILRHGAPIKVEMRVADRGTK